MGQRKERHVDRVAVLTAQPGPIKEIVAIDWPRPRDPFAPKSTAPSPSREYRECWVSYPA
jgi:ABC-type nitrate/sulfonate/bicarbonate transport system ATPase subunit